MTLSNASRLPLGESKGRGQAVCIYIIGLCGVCIADKDIMCIFFMLVLRQMKQSPTKKLLFEYLTTDIPDTIF